MSSKPAAVFTQGSILRHVLVMTLTSGVGLMAVFLIDVMSMFYVSMAHRDTWQAAVNLVSKVLYFPFALNLGMIVGIGTVVSVAIGRGDLILARRTAMIGLMLIGFLGLAASFAALPWRVEILHLFGASGEALDIASRLLLVTLPVNVLLSVGMGCASILRACGDPSRAMLVTLAGGVATSIADPIFIFGLHQGVDGVGSAIVVSRVVFVLVGLWGVIAVHRMVAAPRLPRRLEEIEPIAIIAVPAIVANLSLPFADWYVTRTIWQFGVASAAAAGTYDRIMPFAFGLILALASAVSPIVGQNLGAGAFHRVRLVFTRSLLLTGGYGALVWLVMFLAAPALAQIFHLDEPASRFFIFLCRYATITWIVIGFMLVANAIFNTLGRAHLAMLFNWGRATLGTMPFVSVGATYGGPEFAMMGLAVSAALFAGGAVLVARRLILQLGHGLTSTAVLSDRDAAVILGPAVGVSADA